MLNISDCYTKCGITLVWRLVGHFFFFLSTIGVFCVVGVGSVCPQGVLMSGPIIADTKFHFVAFKLSSFQRVQAFNAHVSELGRWSRQLQYNGCMHAVRFCPAGDWKPL